MKNKLTTMAGVAAALIGFSATVQAVPTLTLSDNIGDSVSVNATGGVASYNGAVGEWTVNVSTGIANGTTTFPVIDLNSVDQFSSGLGNILTITFTDDNLGPLASTYLDAVGGTENGTADVFGVMVNGVLLSSSIQSFSGTPFSGTASGAISGSFPTTLTIGAQLTASAGGQTSFDDHLTVPDGGATVMMLGAALSAIGLLRKKMIA
jgi:hypothetical protein